jgi:putative phosphoesterase
VKVAALYDVHANLPALKAVLAEVERESVETVLFGGDLVYGPQPVETLARVRSVPGAQFVRGNCDREPDEWERSQLSDEEAAFLHGLPETLEIVTPATTDEELAGILEGVGQRVVVAGHTHMQQDRRIGAIRFVNAGSVGLPYEGELAAFWALLDGGEPELRKTPLELEKVAEAFRLSAWPHAEEFLRENVLETVTREEATAAQEERKSQGS